LSSSIVITIHTQYLDLNIHYLKLCLEHNRTIVINI